MEDEREEKAKFINIYCSVHPIVSYCLGIESKASKYTIPQIWWLILAMPSQRTWSWNI